MDPSPYQQKGYNRGGDCIADNPIEEDGYRFTNGTRSITTGEFTGALGGTAARKLGFAKGLTAAQQDIARLRQPTKAHLVTA
jgi:hypothetical protein